MVITKNNNLFVGNEKCQVIIYLTLFISRAFCNKIPNGSILREGNLYSGSQVKATVHHSGEVIWQTLE